MIEILPEEEKMMLDDYISIYAFEESSDNDKRVFIEKILKPWEKAKSEYLFKLFGNQLVIKKKFSIPTSMDELYYKMNIMQYSDKARPFVQEFQSLTGFTGYYQYDNNVSSLMDSTHLASNRWDKEDFSISLPGHLRPYKVQKGTKIIKVLKKIAKAHHLEGFEDFRIAHSMVTNKVHSGTVCLSIHPFDYMTMSDSKCKWSSCMDWDGGEYRMGTVEMMNSTCAVVAYIEGEEAGYAEKYLWPSKPWRELFCIDNNLITGVLGYPYSFPSLENFILDWLKELAYENLGWEYLPEKFTYNACQFQGSYCEGLDKHIRIIPETGHMYSDFGDEQVAYISADIPSEYYLQYSGVSECMCCGEIYPDIETDTEGAMPLVCISCESFARCEHCHCHLDDNDINDLEGHIYCDWCYNDYARTDVITGEDIHYDSVINIYLSLDGGKTILRNYYISVSEEWERNRWDDRNLFREEWTALFKVPRWRTAIVPHMLYSTVKYYFNKEDLTEEGFLLFDLDEGSYSVWETEQFNQEEKTPLDF